MPKKAFNIDDRSGKGHSSFLRAGSGKHRSAASLRAEENIRDWARQLGYAYLGDGARWYLANETEELSFDSVIQVKAFLHTKLKGKAREETRDINAVVIARPNHTKSALRHGRGFWAKSLPLAERKRRYIKRLHQLHKLRKKYGVDFKE